MGGSSAATLQPNEAHSAIVGTFVINKEQDLGRPGASFLFSQTTTILIWWTWLPLNLLGVLVSSEFPGESVPEFSFKLPCLAQHGEAHTCPSLLAACTQCRSYFCDFSLARISIVSVLMVSLGLAGAQAAFPKPLRAFSPCPSLAPVAA